MCPELELVEQDPATAEQAWEEILRRLEDAGFARRAGRAGHGLLRDEGRRAALRRPRAGAEAGARRGRDGLGRARRGGRAAVRGARRGERRAAGAGADRLRRPHALVPRAAAADAPAARARPLRGAGGAREFERSDSLPGCRVAPLPNDWGRTAGAPGAWRGESRTGRWRRDGRRRPARDARVPGSSRQRADAPARARGAARPPARTAGTRGAAAAGRSRSGRGSSAAPRGAGR